MEMTGFHLQPPNEVLFTKEILESLKKDDLAWLHIFLASHKPPIFFKFNNPKQIFSDSQPLISVACFYKAANIVQEILKNDDLIQNVYDKKSRHPAIFAAASDSVDILEMLKKSKLNYLIGNVDNKEMGILHYAAQRDAAKAFEWGRNYLKEITKEDSHLNDQSSFGCPIHIACQNKSEAVLNYMISLNLEQIQFNNTNGIDKFVDMPVSMNAVYLNSTPLTILLETKSYDIIPKLVKAGLFLDEQFYNNWPTLFLAIKSHFELVVKLVELGCSLDVCSSSNWTCMHVAAQERNQKAVKLFLEKGVNPHTLTKEKNSPFSLCSSFHPMDKDCQTAELLRNAIVERVAKMLIKHTISSLKQ